MENSIKKTKPEEKNPKVVIMGGGPAGLTAGYLLSGKNIETVVLEKDNVVGGISRTVHYKDYYFDLGGHRFFTKIDRVNKIWKEVLADNFLKCSRLSRIYYNKKFFHYPLKPLNALFGLGFINSLLILFSFYYAQLFPSKEEKTFEQWVSNRFGERLYRTFFKTYTEKVWGIPCNEIMAEWAAQRIRGLSLIKAIKGGLIKQNHITTLIDSFEYPKYGPGMMWNKVSDRIQKKDSKVLLKHGVESIFWSNNSIRSVTVKNSNGTSVFSGTDFISSLPVRELIKSFNPKVPDAIIAAADSLKYRDFLTVALMIDKPDIFPDNWIYIHDPEVKLGRVQNFKNWSPYMVPDKNKTCLGLEYFCFEGDSLWTKSDKELIELGKRELDQLKLINPDDVYDGKVVRIPKAYPVYDATYMESLEVIKDFLAGFSNLQLIGRNGMHRYNNMDHSMITGIYAAENIQGEKHNLWNINEEQEYHEEISDRSIKVIKKTFARLDKLGFATAIGVTCGLILFCATLFLALKGGESIGTNMSLLSQYFIGYNVNVKGAFIGFGYSFLWGFLFGWVFAYLRNLLLGFVIYRIKIKVQMLSFKDFLEHY